jgi:hypothetical protein
MYSVDQAKDATHRADRALGAVQDTQSTLNSAESMAFHHIGARRRWGFGGTTYWERNGTPVDLATAVAEVEKLAAQYTGDPGQPVAHDHFGLTSSPP